MQANVAHNLEEKSRTNDILIKENVNFNSLLLSTPTLQGLKEAGFYKPSPIQLKAIPLGRCGLDLIVQAKSGTGKTAVFTVIALEMINVTRNALQVLILAPTREIAIQIEDVIRTIGQALPGLQVASFIGGLPIEEDYKKLKNCHIAVGAPGRLKHLVAGSRLKTDAIRLFVLDEADKLMEQSFQNDINFIYHKLPQRKQVLVLSATYPDKLDEFLRNYMQSPTFVTPEIENPVLLGLRQFVSVVKSHINVTRQLAIKNAELIRLLSNVRFTQCLIFFNSQMRAEGISHTLNKDGWNTTYISAAQSQVKRIKAINSLKKLECKILLSTDLTARGIDAANVDLVINYDVPVTTATYLHRMGRAGRYGAHGICVTIAGENAELRKFQNILGEIGGNELGVAKLPSAEEEFCNVWECDFNLCEKVYGAVNAGNTRLNLQKVVLDLKNGKDVEVPVSEVNDGMSTDLHKLSDAESSNQAHRGNDGQVEIENIKDVLNHKQKMQEQINQQCSGMDAAALLKSLASGESVLPENLKEDKAESSKDIVKSLKSLASAKHMSTEIGNKKDQSCSFPPTTHNKDLLVTGPNNLQQDQQGCSISTTSSSKDVLSNLELVDQTRTNDSESDLVDPASLYPWVPVEGDSVLKYIYKGSNLLEDSEEEDCDQEVSRTSHNRKRKRRQFDRASAQSRNNIKQSPENSPLVKNLALYGITQLLTDDSMQDMDLIVSRIGDYLNVLQENRQALRDAILKHFKNRSTTDILKNIAQYTEEWLQLQAVNVKQLCETEDPEEDIFKLGYFYMNKNTGHWIDALGNKYDPGEEEYLEEDDNVEFVDAEEEMEGDEFDKGYGHTTSHSREYDYETTNPGTNHYNHNSLEWMPSDNNQVNLSGNSTNLEYPYNATFASHFYYYKEMIERDGLAFEDVTSFDAYFRQWQQHVRSVTDYVQQNVYLQEMNNYQYYRGQYNQPCDDHNDQ